MRHSTQHTQSDLKQHTDKKQQKQQQVDAAQRRVTQSKIFQWYAPDFGDTKASRLRFLLPFLPPDKRDALQGMLDADPSAASITVQHREYDWRLNGADE